MHRNILTIRRAVHFTLYNKSDSLKRQPRVVGLLDNYIAASLPLTHSFQCATLVSK